jgi:hypothetical protein
MLTLPTPWYATVDRIESASRRPVDGRSLAVVRIAFGAIGLISAVRLVTRGWVGTLLVGPSHHLRYAGMEWVPVPPGPGIHLLVTVVGIASVLVMLGWRHRAAMVVFWLAFTWLEFIEATSYLNHYWFMTLTGALMVVLPMSATWSLDARRRGERQVPAGAVWLVRFQVGAVYCFAGIAKLHGDWLLHGLPLGLWLPARSHLPGIGALLEQQSAALVASWAGAAFDCLVVGFLLWRRTRLAAWMVVVVFHLVTWWLFPIIGVFPWLMIAMSTVFFDPDWPTRLWRRIAVRSATALPSGPPPATTPRPQCRRGTSGADGSATRRRVVVGCAAIWVSLQLLLPLRHLAYPGDHRWTGEGLRFGWNVMLVEKAGEVSFRVTDPTTGATWRETASDLFTAQQRRVVATEPELIRQAAHVVADAASGPGTARPEVRADAMVSLNGRPAERLIDPDTDLAAEPWRLGPQPWILPAPTTPPPG